MPLEETYRLAFNDPPGTNLAGIPTTNLELISPYVTYGLPYDKACAKHVSDTFKASRVFILASGSLSRDTNRVDRLISAIGKEKVVGVQRGMTPHTPWDEIVEIAAQCRDLKADCFVTLGAGSLTDGAKIVVLALANDIHTVKELAQYSIESPKIPANVKPPTVPLITIPTSLSGGEYFSLAGGTDPETHHKQAFLFSGMGSKLVILDPELCTTTPPYHWLSTGVRSLDHCVEALCSLSATPESDKKASQGLKMLVPSLLKCKQDGQDVQARHECQMAVILAMDNIRAGIPMGGSHAIGHQLGPLGVPHGITSCIMCPAVMEYNIKYGKNPEIHRRQDMVKEILWSEPEVANTLETAHLSQESSLAQCLDAVIRALELPRTLTDVGIATSDIQGLATRALDDFWSPTNPIPLLKADQVAEILQTIL